MPHTLTNTIRVLDYNYIQNQLTDIIGLGPDGYGQGSHNSSPATTRSTVRRNQWVNVINDMNFVQAHITNSTTSTQAPATGTTILNTVSGSLILGTTITNTITNALIGNIDYLADPVRRYTCHPTQLYGYPGDTINSLNGTSTRATLWSKEISHKVRIDWPTNLIARYFFNSGGTIVWRPNYLSAVGTDRDQDWANFIDHLQNQGGYEYKRDDFVNATNPLVTTYNSGTLTVIITADRYAEAVTQRVDFTAVLRNNDVPDVVVAPTYAFWNYGPWEAFVTDATTATAHISGVQSASGTYSAQGGFSLDRVSGVVILYMGVWPSDPPNNQTCNWEWLAFSNLGLNKLGNDSTSNGYRIANNIRPYWTMGGEYNLSSITLSTSVDYQIPFWPYTLVPYTYRITRTSSNSVSIQTYPSAWDTGDNGTTISVENWWINMQVLWGTDGTTLGTGTFTW